MRFDSSTCDQESEMVPFSRFVTHSDLKRVLEGAPKEGLCVLLWGWEHINGNSPDISIEYVSPGRYYIKPETELGVMFVLLVL
jgi:hypothetical protein